MEATDVRLACDCGAFTGVARGISPTHANHVVCYCDDCQAFLRAIGRGDLLDDHGGSHLVQMSPARLEITGGGEHLACLRLSPKGMVRWHTTCCRTPVANTLESASPPFVGMHRVLFRATTDDRPAAEAIGPILARVQGRWATGDPATLQVDRFPLRFGLQVARLGLTWWWRGDARTSPLRDATGAPKVAPRILTPDERKAAYRAP